MSNVVLLPKDDQRIPDFYGIKFEFITGKIVEYKVASHLYNTQLRFIELITFENEYVVIPLDNIIIHFDKEYTKMVKIYKELQEKKEV